MSASQFGSTASAGGTASQTTQNPKPSSSSAKNQDSHPLLPSTIKQIFQASESRAGSLVIDGVDVDNVRAIGMVFRKEEGKITISFDIYDGTAEIVCFLQVDRVDKALVHKRLDSMEEILNGMYVRADGHLRSLRGILYLSVFSFWRVTNYDDIPNHFYECMQVHKYHKVLQSGGPVLSMPTSAVRLPQNQSAPPNQYNGYHDKEGFKEVVRLMEMVIDYLQQPQCLAQEKGVNVDVIAQDLGVAVEKLTMPIMLLKDEGLVCSMIHDHEHYCKSPGN